MRIDFKLDDDEILTARIIRKHSGFRAICGATISEGKTVPEAIENLQHRLKRHFLKLRCKTSLAANPTHKVA